MFMHIYRISDREKRLRHCNEFTGLQPPNSRRSEEIAVSEYKFFRFRRRRLFFLPSTRVQTLPACRVVHVADRSILCAGRRTPRVGLYIGMFARVIVARPTLDTFLPESGFKKRLEPLMAPTTFPPALREIPLLLRGIS